jgi:uncharacterized protein YegJ (DUF2314 family)
MIDDLAFAKASGETNDQSVGTFIAVLKSPKANQESFRVKRACTDGKHAEPLWLSTMKFDGKNFHGTADKDPKLVNKVRLS